MVDIKQELIKCGAVKFGDFTLASGKKNKYYVDIKQAIGDPDRLNHIGNEIWLETLSQGIKFDAVACVELGGVPIGVMVSHISGKPLIIIRKEIKDHGIKNRIIGDAKGMRVLLVEDVTTTGGTVIKAINTLHDAGAKVHDVVSVVDRGEGAGGLLGDGGVRLFSLVSAQELLAG
jgi:orotate phosphoribosyltransferase